MSTPRLILLEKSGRLEHNLMQAFFLQNEKKMYRRVFDSKGQVDIGPENTRAWVATEPRRHHRCRCQFGFRRTWKGNWPFLKCKLDLGKK